MRWLYITNIIFFLWVSLIGYRGDVPTPLTVWGTPGKGTWFESMKAYCNPVEVGMAMKRNPPPADNTSRAYAAACYALAGKIDQARHTLDGFPRSQRQWAANIVFNVAHPIADMGDDKAAGPIMKLVVHYIPNHYMALYHAGLSLYATGYPVEAAEYLNQFLKIYKNNDHWTQRATMVLRKIRAQS